MSSENNDPILHLTGQIVTAYVSNNQIAPHELTALVAKVYEELSTKTSRVSAGGDVASARDADAELKPAVPVRRSVTDDYLICLEDGVKLKMLKKHLRVHYDMTPEQYRAKWGLPKDYPMVAKNYAALRSEQARKIGLGRKPGTGRVKKVARA